MGKWTDEDRSRVAEALRNGATTYDLSKMLGLSRNTVQGRVYRDKMLSAIGFKTPSYRDMRGRKQAAAVMGVPVVAPKPFVPTYTDFDKESRNVSLADLGPHECKWVTNDPEPGVNSHLFCGHPQRAGSVYCTHHHSRAYRTTGKDTHE